jgi:hypothetical protein
MMYLRCLSFATAVCWAAGSSGADECEASLGHSTDGDSAVVSLTVPTSCSCDSADAAYALRQVTLVVVAAREPAASTPSGWEAVVAADPPKQWELRWHPVQDVEPAAALDFAARLQRSAPQRENDVRSLQYARHAADYGACAVGGVAGGAVAGSGGLHNDGLERTKRVDGRPPE